VIADIRLQLKGATEIGVWAFGAHAAKTVALATLVRPCASS
jgi:hypothetical protein